MLDVAVELRLDRGRATTDGRHGGRPLQPNPAIFAEVFAAEPRWRTLTPRLVPAGLLPDDPAALERILAASP